MTNNQSPCLPQLSVVEVFCWNFSRNVPWLFLKWHMNTINCPAKIWQFILPKVFLGISLKHCFTRKVKKFIFQGSIDCFNNISQYSTLSVGTKATGNTTNPLKGIATQKKKSTTDLKSKLKLKLQVNIFYQNLIKMSGFENCVIG